MRNLSTTPKLGNIMKDGTATNLQVPKTTYTEGKDTNHLSTTIQSGDIKIKSMQL